MMRRYALLTLTATIFSFSCFAENSGIIPVYKDRSGKWLLLLQKEQDTEFLTYISDELPSGGDPESVARQAVETQTNKVYKADKISISQPLVTPSGDHLFFSLVRPKELKTARLQWIPIETILSATPSSDLHTVLQQNWTTIRDGLEASHDTLYAERRKPSTNEPRSELFRAYQPNEPKTELINKPIQSSDTSGEAPETAVSAELSDRKEQLSGADASKGERKEGPVPKYVIPSSTPAPLTTNKVKAQTAVPMTKGLSFTNYPPIPATTKFITYKVVPAVRSAAKKRSTHHSKNCRRRCRRRAAALLLHRKHRSKKFCRKVCKALIRKRRQRTRAMIHRKRPKIN